MTLDSILASYHNGSTPEEIAIQFSVLRLEDIYSTLAYYLNHRQEIDSYTLSGYSFWLLEKGKWKKLFTPGETHDQTDIYGRRH